MSRPCEKRIRTLYVQHAAILPLERHSVKSPTNTFAGKFVVTNGTLKPGNYLALGGAAAGNTIATNGGTLDVNPIVTQKSIALMQQRMVPMMERIRLRLGPPGRPEHKTI